MFMSTYLRRVGKVADSFLICLWRVGIGFALWALGRVDVSFLTCLSKGEIPNTAGGGLERTRMGANLWGYDDHPDSPLGGVLRYIHVFP